MKSLEQYARYELYRPDLPEEQTWRAYKFYGKNGNPYVKPNNTEERQMVYS